MCNFVGFERGIFHFINLRLRVSFGKVCTMRAITHVSFADDLVLFNCFMNVTSKGLLTLTQFFGEIAGGNRTSQWRQILVLAQLPWFWVKRRKYRFNKILFQVWPKRVRGRHRGHFRQCYCGLKEPEFDLKVFGYLFNFESNVQTRSTLSSLTSSARTRSATTTSSKWRNVSTKTWSSLRRARRWATTCSTASTPSYWTTTWAASCPV